VRCAKKQAETCTSEKHEKIAKISTGQGKFRLVLPNPFRSFPLVSAYGSRFGSWKKRKNSSEYFKHKSKEKFLISCEIRNFLVETTGLEPVTSCV